MGLGKQIYSFLLQAFVEKTVSEYSSVDEDGILEVLSSYNCKKLPTADNVKIIIDE